MNKELVIRYNPYLVIIFFLSIGILICVYQIYMLNIEIFNIQKCNALNIQNLINRINELEQKSLLTNLSSIKSSVNEIDPGVQRDLLKYLMVFLSVVGVLGFGYFGFHYVGGVLFKTFPVKFLCALNSSLLGVFNNNLNNKNTAVVYEFTDPGTQYLIKFILQGDACELWVKLPSEQNFVTLNAAIDIASIKASEMLLSSPSSCSVVDSISKIIF